MWLYEKRKNAEMTVSPIGLDESREWRKRDGVIQHVTGGFFSIGGVTSNSDFSDLNGIEQPIIKQPETGLLGFIVMPHGNTFNWLVQAKPEPGNVAAVQLAPTVQATRSNYTRQHGGAPTHYLDFFIRDCDSLATNSLQSEQGTRFLHKFNRNAIRLVTQDPGCQTANFRWFTPRQLKATLLEDYSVNTDARSVIVSAPWHMVTEGEMPFKSARFKGWPALTKSYLTPVRPTLIGRMATALRNIRSSVGIDIQHVDLEELRRWSVNEQSIASTSGHGPFEIKFYSVDAPEREKPCWDQPLLQSKTVDNVTLFAQERDGVLQFLLRFSFEIGLQGGAEFGPSYKQESAVPPPAWIQEALTPGNGRKRISVEQSEEGGRFMHSRCKYSIIELPDTFVPGDGDGNFWLTLSELEAVCRTPKLLTNEARSAISILLGFA